MTKQLVSVVTGRIPAGFDSKAVSITGKLSQIEQSLSRGILDYKQDTTLLVKSSKICLDPDYAHLKRVTHSTRRCSNGVIIFHYYRFSEPSSERSTTIRFYDKDHCEFWALPLTKLSEWLGSPTIYIFDSGDSSDLVDEMRAINPEAVAFGCAEIVVPGACSMSDGCPKGLLSNCIASPGFTFIKSLQSKSNVTEISQSGLIHFEKILLAIAEAIARSLWDLEISSRLLDPSSRKVTLAAIVSARIAKGDFFSSMVIDWNAIAGHPLWLLVDSIADDFSASETYFHDSRVLRWAMSAFRVDPQHYLLPLMMLCLEDESCRGECINLLDESSVPLVAFHRAIASIPVKYRGLTSRDRVQISRLISRIVIEDASVAEIIIQLVGRKLQSWISSSDSELRQISRSTLSLLEKSVPSFSSLTVPVSMQSMAKENGMLFQNFLGKSESVKQISRSTKTAYTKPHAVTLSSVVTKIFSISDFCGISVFCEECVFWDERNLLFYLGSKSHRPRHLEISNPQNLRDVKLNEGLIALIGDQLDIYSIERGMEICSLPRKIESAFFTADSSSLMSCSSSGLSFWDITTAQETGRLSTDFDVVTTCQLERLTCMGCRDGQLRLLDPRRFDKFPVSMRSGCAVVCMHGHDWRVALGSAGGDFEMWDVRVNKQLACGKFEECVSHFDVHASGVALYDFQDESHLGFISRSGESVSIDFIGSDEQVRAVQFLGENSLCLTDKSLYLIESS